jgi:hypothetical protein
MSDFGRVITPATFLQAHGQLKTVVTQKANSSNLLIRGAPRHDWGNLNQTVRGVEMGPSGTQPAFPEMRFLGPGLIDLRKRYWLSLR